MSDWDRVVMADWSGGNDTGPRPKKDAIWACAAEDGKAEAPVYLRSRIEAEAWLRTEISAALEHKRRLMIGFDFPFGYPEGFARAITGSDDPFALWDDITRRISDSPKENNRFDVAAAYNRMCPGIGPFWGNGLARDIDDLPRKARARLGDGFPERRAAEKEAKGAFTLWQLSGAGAVGSQTLMGIPVLNRLRRDFEGQVHVWPFEALDAPVAFVEIWPSLFVSDAPEGWIKDAWQVAEVARMVSQLPGSDLARILADADAPEEGWIFGLGFEALLRGDPIPPPLRNDCFALTQGVDWIPVDETLAHLRQRLAPVTELERVSLFEASGRVLAENVRAARSHPPLANTAVDGYGFAGGRAEGTHTLPLVSWSVTAGAASSAPVPRGQAVRILTGASLPPGVDTVILQEDVTARAGKIAFNGPLKTGANTRAAGEDVTEGETIARQTRRLTPGDIGLLAATGISEVTVRKGLRVGVLSTGDEVVAPGADAGHGQIFDANRPMLLSLIRRLGHVAVDLGHVRDDRAALRNRLDQAAAETDAILTSGGASSGDEDHVSALLKETGALALWRIAVKPGRPLALGLWQKRPVFGLPGNPVAAMVCTLVFARPALSVLAGEAWPEPVGFDVPAAFSKRKKQGRREYLRARIQDGCADVFASEGSGRISGLSWADGLVELTDDAQEISPGDPVRFIPWSGFGL